MRRFEYCTQVSINEEDNSESLPDFDGIAFFAALFGIRRLHLTLREVYSSKMEWLNQTGSGKALSKLPCRFFMAWNRNIKGHLPIDREHFISSLTGARNREFGVCRIKDKMLHNSRTAREAPSLFVVDEQIVPYTGHLSGAKMRLPKKTSEGLEYFTIATSNKEYEGYKEEIREDSKEGDPEGAIISARDPVSGGYKLNYKLETGPKYEIASPAGSKMLGILMLLIFQLGPYLRYSKICLVTDSAYSFVEGMCLMALWGINWVSSLRIKQRKGFRRIKEIEAKSLAIRGKEKDVTEPNFKKVLTAWEKEQKDEKKGTS